jgi:hypothetical protein
VSLVPLSASYGFSSPAFISGISSASDFWLALGGILGVSVYN